MLRHRRYIVFIVPIALLVYNQFSHLFKLTTTSDVVEISDHPWPVNSTKTAAAAATTATVHKRALRNETKPNGTREHTDNVIFTGDRNTKSPFASIDIVKTEDEAYRDVTRNDERVESCLAIKIHEKGHWNHLSSASASDVLDDIRVKQQYFPREIDWMKGFNLLANFNKTQCNGTLNGEMYITGIGNQCGCDASGFRPTYSTWVYEEDGINVTTPQHSILRLAHRLIKNNSTLCFAGDSIDLQLYQSIERQIQRLENLQQLYFNTSLNVSLETREVPVNYNTQCGKIHAGFRPCGFKAMSSLKEMLFRSRYESDSGRIGVVRYIKFYGWSPWNVQFMEDCNIVIMNLGLHYDPRGEMLGKHYAPLIEDMYAAITYLTNLTNSKNNNSRIAIWRSALPQHFDTSDGNYNERELKQSKVKACVPVRDPKSKQPYNQKYDEAFSRMCNEGMLDGIHLSTCGGMWHTCTANLTSRDFYSVYSYWLRNNLTKEVEDFTRQHNATVVGKILRWNIYDLFDQYTLHSEDIDCTHFCFVPWMFDAAFHRLNLMLSAFSS